MKITPLIRVIRQNLRINFERYARNCLFIRQKSGKITPFFLNEAQKHIHEQLEAQLKSDDHVRALIVKGRQQGCSTYVAGRFFWKATHRQGARVFILAHLEEASRNLAGIVKRFHMLCPAVMRPKLTEANQRVMAFGFLDSGYKIGTAKSAGVGRSDTIQYFHGSEVAYWSNARAHIAGILQSIPAGDRSEVILESTSDGPHGVFYDMCMAAKAGQSGYQLIFVPWFWQKEYQARQPKNFILSEDEIAYQQQFGLNERQMIWRRNKIVELGGIWQFRREYPATLEEAFHSDIKGALWTRMMIAENRVMPADCPAFERVIVAIDPAITAGKNSDETGIIVAARGSDGDAYILKDASGTYSPAGWAARAIALYHEFEADRIVVETNQGGDMAVHTLKTEDLKIPVKKLHASRGKYTRAEPVAALDEQGRKLEKINDDLSRMETTLQRTARGETKTDDVDEAALFAKERKANNGGAFDVKHYNDYKSAMQNYVRRNNAGSDIEEIKALSAGSDPDGGYWVTPDISGRITQLVYESSPVRQVANVVTIGTDTLEGIVHLGEAGAGWVGAGWVGETDARVETTSPTIDQYSIPVHELYAEPRATQRLLDDALFNVDEWLALKIAERLARLENTAFVSGDGIGKPKGFLTHAAGTPSAASFDVIEQIHSGAAGGFAASNPGDALINLVFSLKAQYRDNAVFMMKRSTLAAVRKLKDADGNYLWTPDFQTRQGGTLLGFNVLEAEDMPDIAADSLSIAFGDFKAGYQIVDRQGVRILRDNLTAKPYVKFYTTKRVGGNVVNFDAIKLMKFAL